MTLRFAVFIICWWYRLADDSYANPTVRTTFAWWQLWSTIVCTTTSFFGGKCMKNNKIFPIYIIVTNLQCLECFIHYLKNQGNEQIITEITKLVRLTSCSSYQENQDFLLGFFCTKSWQKVKYHPRNPRSWQEMPDNSRKCKILARKPKCQALGINDKKISNNLNFWRFYVDTK